MKKDKVDFDSVESFNVEMKKICHGRHTIVLENPRDEETLDEAAENLRNILEEYIDGETLYGLEDDFKSSKKMNRTCVIADSYEVGEDVTIGMYRVSTDDYLNYTVEFAVFMGLPMSAFMKAFDCKFE